MEEKKVMKKSKAYFILCTINLLFALGFILCCLADNNYGAFMVGRSTLYLIVVTPCYAVFYGIISYKVTKQIWRPALLFELFLCFIRFLVLFISFHQNIDSYNFHEDIISYLFDGFLRFLLFTSVFVFLSLLSSVITKLVCKLYAKYIQKRIQ